MLDAKVHQVFSPPLASLSQKQHIRKAKLLNHVVHVETLMQRTNSQESLGTISNGAGGHGGAGNGSAGASLPDKQPITSKPSDTGENKSSCAGGGGGLTVTITNQPSSLMHAKTCKDK